MSFFSYSTISARAVWLIDMATALARASGSSVLVVFLLLCMALSAYGRRRGRVGGDYRNGLGVPIRCDGGEWLVLWMGSPERAKSTAPVRSADAGRYYTQGPSTPLQRPQAAACRRSPEDDGDAAERWIWRVSQGSEQRSGVADDLPASLAGT